MELTIFKSIVYGELKPWASNAINDKFYRQNLSTNFIKPTLTINEYFKALKAVSYIHIDVYKRHGYSQHSDHYQRFSDYRL